MCEKSRKTKKMSKASKIIGPTELVKITHENFENKKMPTRQNEKSHVIQL